MTFTAGDRVTGLDWPPAVSASSQTEQLNQTSTSYVTGSPEVGVYFTAPISGRVLITVGGGARDNTNDNRVFTSVEVLAGDANGEQFLAPSVPTGGWGTMGTNANYMFASRTFLLSGLTPQVRYYARVMTSVETTTSTSADTAVRDIIVEPVS